MDSVFNPDDFLNSQQSAEFDTRALLHNAGDWDGYIGAGEKDIVIRTVQTTDKQSGAQQERQIMEVGLYTEDPRACPDGAKPPMRCRLSIWLDMAPDGKSLDKTPGKNRGLGYLLTATGHQDKTGKQVKSWSKSSLAGQRVKYRVAHSPRKDTGELQAEVSQVAAAV